MADYTAPPVPALPVPPPPPTDSASWKEWYERAWYWLQVENYKLQHRLDWDAQQRYAETNPVAVLAGIETHFGTLLDAIERWLNKAAPPVSPPFDLS